MQPDALYKMVWKFDLKYVANANGDKWYEWESASFVKPVENPQTQAKLDTAYKASKYLAEEKFELKTQITGAKEQPKLNPGMMQGVAPQAQQAQSPAQEARPMLQAQVVETDLPQANVVINQNSDF